MPFAKLASCKRVGLAVDHRGQHRPRRHRLQAGRDRGQLDGGVFQHQLQPDDLSGPIPHQLHPVAGQHPQPPDLRWRHERRRQQSVLQQLRDPLRVTDVAFAAGHRLHVRGVQQPHHHHLFQAVERRLPIRRGRLHRRNGHPGLDQPVPHHPQRAEHRLEGARLAAPPTARARRADAHRHRILADIQTGDPVEHDLHGVPLSDREATLASQRRSGGTSARTQTRVLVATIQRQPRPPRHTPQRARPHQCVSTSPADPPFSSASAATRRAQPITPHAPPEVARVGLTAPAACTPFGWV